MVVDFLTSLAIIVLYFGIGFVSVKIELVEKASMFGLKPYIWYYGAGQNNKLQHTNFGKFVEFFLWPVFVAFAVLSFALLGSAVVLSIVFGFIHGRFIPWFGGLFNTKATQDIQSVIQCASTPSLTYRCVMGHEASKDEVENGGDKCPLCGLSSYPTAAQSDAQSV